MSSAFEASGYAISTIFRSTNVLLKYPTLHARERATKPDMCSAAYEPWISGRQDMRGRYSSPALCANHLSAEGQSEAL